MNFNMECPYCHQDTQANIFHQTPVIQCFNHHCGAQWDDDGIIRLSPRNTKSTPTPQPPHTN